MVGKPLAIDLFCGLGGWADGFLAEGYEVVGFDIERHQYMRNRRDDDVAKTVGAEYCTGIHQTETKNKATSIGRPSQTLDGTVSPAVAISASQHPINYPAQLVIQDVLTLHGSQFRDAAVIVASPPCQNYSYLAMPWSRSTNPENSKAAKALRKKWEIEGPDNRLFDACFRIHREAIEATRKPCVCWSGKPYCNICGGKGSFTRFIPLIVENVRGAQPWVGRSAWNYGSFHLWGDVPALMPFSRGRKVPGFRFDGSGRSFQTASVAAPGQKVPVYSDPRRNSGKGVHLTSPAENNEGVKQSAGRGDGFSKGARNGGASARYSSKSSARKAASAQIAKIPLDLSVWIAKCYYPR